MEKAAGAKKKEMDDMTVRRRGLGWMHVVVGYGCVPVSVLGCVVVQHSHMVHDTHPLTSHPYTTTSHDTTTTTGEAQGPEGAGGADQGRGSGHRRPTRGVRAGTDT